MKRVGFMFAGQGAQSVGMGRDLYQSSAAAKAVFDQADAILERDLSGVCFDGPAAALTASATCQPAIYTMSLACVAALSEKAEIAPAVCGGLSLGEFAALTTAGVLEFDDGLRLVARRGELMDAACRATDGAMAAVIGADPGLVAEICEQCDVDVANLNCPGQIVISGQRQRLADAAAGLERAGAKRVVMLEVAGAYHSRLMMPAAEAFSEVLAEVSLQEPAFPVVQNVSGGMVTDPEAIRANLASQVTGSVRWEACVRTMLEQDIDALIELGPGRVLSGFMKRIDRRFPVANVGAAADLEAAAALVEDE